MGGADFFSRDYAMARARFRRGAEALGLELEVHPVGQLGPLGEELSIDVVCLGDPQPSRAVVVSSGLHGVEGFFGSAVQAALLEGRFKGWQAPPGLRVVLLHALNPYGFAWLRRVNEHNVDLNRNFLRPGEAFSGSHELYAKLDPLLNPTRPPGRFSGFYPKAAGYVARYGMPALKNAVAGGQFDFPQGLFYGGRRPERTQEILAEHLAGWIGPAEQIYHVDFHTGLGRWATYRLLVDHPLGHPKLPILVGAFGEGVEPWEPEQGVSYEIRGGLGLWCQDRFADRDYELLVAEFGTVPTLAVSNALHLENRAHHWGHPECGRTAAAKRRLRDVFAPPERRWRDKVVPQGLDLVERAIAALLRGAPRPVAKTCAPF